LAGRVYKDKFISSGYEDKQALDKAIEWSGYFFLDEM
jgi:hypothetical protein